MVDGTTRFAALAHLRALAARALECAASGAAMRRGLHSPRRGSKMLKIRYARRVLVAPQVALPVAFVSTV